MNWHFQVVIEGQRVGCFKFKSNAGMYARHQGPDYDVQDVEDSICPCRVGTGKSMSDFDPVEKAPDA